MPNQELQIEVAKAMGWTRVEISGGQLRGLKPKKAGFYMGLSRIPHFSKVPNWPKDLPKCMEDLWPWLWEKKASPNLSAYSRYAICDVVLLDVHSNTHFTFPVSFVVYLGDDVDIMTACARAICHAVLAVVEKLKEQGHA